MSPASSASAFEPAPGLIVNNLQIPGRDAGEAARKVQQLYRDCVILENYGCAVVDADAGQVFGGADRRYG